MTFRLSIWWEIIINNDYGFLRQVCEILTGNEFFKLYKQLVRGICWQMARTRANLNLFIFSTKVLQMHPEVEEKLGPILRWTLFWGRSMITWAAAMRRGSRGLGLSRCIACCRARSNVTTSFHTSAVSVCAYRPFRHCCSSSKHKLSSPSYLEVTEKANNWNLVLCHALSNIVVAYLAGHIFLRIS